MEIIRSTIDAEDLRPVQLLQELDQADLENLARHFVELEVPADQMVVREGDPAEAFYVVFRGSFAVFRDAVGTPVQLLARLQPGEFFGELGLFGAGRHTASVRTSEASRLLRITKEDFLGFLIDHPEILEKLQIAAAQRHSANVASSLEMGRRREVRIRCGQDVQIGLGESIQTVVVENLSVGGICLTNVPDDWRAGQAVSFSLAIRENELVLHGQVVWRRGETVGIMFTKQSPNHDMIVQMAIRVLVETPA